MTFDPSREKSVVLVPIPMPKGYEAAIAALSVYFPKFTEIMEKVTGIEPKTRELSDEEYYLLTGNNRPVKAIFEFASFKHPVLAIESIQQTIYIFSKKSDIEFSKLDSSNEWYLIEGSMHLTDINLMVKLIESFLWEWKLCGYLNEIDSRGVSEIKCAYQTSFIYDAFSRYK
jgi:hypothetical protein